MSKNRSIKNTSKELSALLKACVPKNISILDRCKIIYRPYITPFADLLNLIPLRSKIFDIGCGNGALLNLIFQTKMPEKIGGVEINKKLVANANELLRNAFKEDKIADQKAGIKEYDGIHLPDLTEYDLILLVDVIHHIPRQQLELFLTRLKNKMKPGAVLICKDIDAGKRILVWFNKLHDLLVSQETGNEISMKKAEEKLPRAGFKVVSSEYKRMLWYPHYTIISNAW